MILHLACFNWSLLEIRQKNNMSIALASRFWEVYFRYKNKNTCYWLYS